MAKGNYKGFVKGNYKESGRGLLRPQREVKGANKALKGLLSRP